VSGVYDPSFRTGSECRRHEVNAERTRLACKEGRIRVSGGQKLHCKDDRSRMTGGQQLRIRRALARCQEDRM
jgi:hypothetical protein